MSHESTHTFEIDGRWYNVPSVGRRSGKDFERDFAGMILRAQREGLLGIGFATKEEAVMSAEIRSMITAPEAKAVSRIQAKDPAVTGGRVRRRHKLKGSRTPFNPGGKQPRGSGGQPFDAIIQSFLSGVR